MGCRLRLSHDGSLSGADGTAPSGGRVQSPFGGLGSSGGAATALLSTTALAILLIVVGLAFFAIPGLVLALGFSFAGPVVLAEGSAGCGALEQSWRLMR